MKFILLYTPPIHHIYYYITYYFYHEHNEQVLNICGQYRCYIYSIGSIGVDICVGIEEYMTLTAYTLL